MPSVLGKFFFFFGVYFGLVLESLNFVPYDYKIKWLCQKKMNWLHNLSEDLKKKLPGFKYLRMPGILEKNL